MGSSKMYRVCFCLCAVASASLGGRGRSALRMYLCVMWSTIPHLCVPMAPPALLCQMDILASAPLGPQDDTARKVTSLNPDCILLVLLQLNKKLLSLPSYLIIILFFSSQLWPLVTHSSAVTIPHGCHSHRWILDTQLTCSCNSSLCHLMASLSTLHNASVQEPVWSFSCIPVLA